MNPRSLFYVEKWPGVDFRWGVVIRRYTGILWPLLLVYFPLTAIHIIGSSVSMSLKQKSGHWYGTLFSDFQQIVGIPMGTNCAPLLADIFLYSYEAEFIQFLLSTGKKKLASQFNFTYRYIDDVLSINNPDFENYLGQMYPAELEIRDTTESNTSASYLDYSCRSRVTVSCALPFTTNVTISTSISQTFRSWVTIIHLRQPMVFLSHSSYGMPGLAPLMNVLRAARLSSKLFGQGYVMERLKSSLRKCYGRYGDLIKNYEVSLSQM